MKNTIWMAKMDTANFTFSAYDNTKESAVFALQQGLANHAFKFNLPEDWYDLDSDVVCDVFTLGNAYRYGWDDPIYTPEEK
jgi:hypothetical protein